MSSVALKFTTLLRSSSSTAPISAPVVGLQRSLRSWYSTDSLNGGNSNEIDEHYDDFLGEKPALQLQGVDPRKGWGSRGVHKAIICGKVGKAPEQKILRNGKTVTIFTVGTGGMYDQRLVGSKDLPKPAQWHRIAVHNDYLGTYAVQKLAKNTPVYVEGDIEIRIYNDSISGEVKNIPEICVRRDVSKKDPTIQIKNAIMEHTCSKLLTQNFHCTTEWLAKKYLHKYKVDPGWSEAGLVQQIKDDLGFTINHMKAWRVKDLAMKWVNGDEKAQYSKLLSYGAELMKTNPGKIRHITSGNRTSDISFDDLKEGLFS